MASTGYASAIATSLSVIVALILGGSNMMNGKINVTLKSYGIEWWSVFAVGIQSVGLQSKRMEDLLAHVERSMFLVVASNYCRFSRHTKPIHIDRCNN